MPWRDAIGRPDEHTTVITHSPGGLAVLRHLQSLAGSWRLGTLALVSGFTDPLPALPELDTFIGDGADVRSLRTHIGRLVVVRSDNDALVPPAHTDALAEQLGASVHLIPCAGHFLADDGVVELPTIHRLLTEYRSTSAVLCRHGRNHRLARLR